MAVSPSSIDVVDQVEIARRAGVAPGTVPQWRHRHADFPEPLVRLAIGPVWLWSEVEAWLARPRPAGRRRAGAVG